MKLCIFESSQPTWSNVESLAARISVWKAAKIETVFLAVDGGWGATWPSTVYVTDPRIPVSENPLPRAVAQLRAAGLSVILVFNVIGITIPAFPIKPEFYMSGSSYYYLWNRAFFDWRKAFILEGLQQTGCDGVALDYIRTGRGEIGAEEPASLVVRRFVEELRNDMPSHLSLMNVSNSLFVIPNREGVDCINWYKDGLLDSIVIYNYSEQFPFRDLKDIPESALWILRSSYNTQSGVVTPKSKIEVERQSREILRRFSPVGYGLFMAEMFTPQHATVFSELSLQEKRR